MECVCLCSPPLFFRVDHDQGRRREEERRTRRECMKFCICVSVCCVVAKSLGDEQKPAMTWLVFMMVTGGFIKTVNHMTAG